ncbi:hypothetical protein CRUP_031457, partial [Coryphaenoides rupestris]
DRVSGGQGLWGQGQGLWGPGTGSLGARASGARGGREDNPDWLLAAGLLRLHTQACSPPWQVLSPLEKVMSCPRLDGGPHRAVGGP